MPRPAVVLTLAAEPASDAAADALFGVWVPAGDEPVRGAAAVEPEEETAPIVWRVDLPPEPESGAAGLTRAEARLRAARSALAEVPSRLQTVVFEVSAAPAYAMPAPANRPEPETTLRRALAELRPESAAVSFGLGDRLDEWHETFDRFTSAVSHLRRIATNLAWVETRSGGRLAARTTVGWTGSVQTVWSTGVDRTPAAEHGRALSLAISSRALALRAFVLALRGAAVLGALLNPGTLPAALPLAWRFVRDVLGEAARARAVWPGGVADAW